MPPNSLVTSILFDLDDTLFDHAGTARAAWVATAAGRPTRHGGSLEGSCQRYSELLKEMHPRVLSGEIPYLAARAQRFQRLLAPDEPGVAGAESRRVAAQHYATTPAAAPARGGARGPGLQA